MFSAVHGHKATLHGTGGAAPVFQKLQHAEHLLLVFRVIKQQVDGAFLAFGFDDAGKVDVVAVAVELYRAVVVHEQGGDPLLVNIHDILQERVQVQAGTDHADDAIFLIPHQHVDPEFGHTEFGIGVYVQMKVAAFLNQLEEPGIFGFVGVQDVAELIIRKFVVGIVVVVAAGITEGDEITVVAEIAPEAFHFAYGVAL